MSSSKTEAEEAAFIDRLTLDLVRDEGEVLSEYKDSLGYSTIGVGRLIDRRKGGGITREESRYLLRNDIARVFDVLDREIPWWRRLDRNRRLVVANMAFNLGPGGLVDGWPNTLAAIEAGEYTKASNLMAASKWAIQVGARADRLIALMRSSTEPPEPATGVEV